jgi:hypothetical protein
MYLFFDVLLNVDQFLYQNFFIKIHSSIAQIKEITLNNLSLLMDK